VGARIGRDRGDSSLGFGSIHIRSVRGGSGWRAVISQGAPGNDNRYRSNAKAFRPALALRLHIIGITFLVNFAMLRLQGSM